MRNKEMPANLKGF